METVSGVQAIEARGGLKAEIVPLSFVDQMSRQFDGPDKQTENENDDETVSAKAGPVRGAELGVAFAEPKNLSETFIEQPITLTALRTGQQQTAVIGFNGGHGSEDLTLTGSVPSPVLLRSLTTTLAGRGSLRVRRHGDATVG